MLSETSTAYSNLFNGGWDAPHRVLKNTTFERWRQAGSPPSGKRPDEGRVVAHPADAEPVHFYDDAIPYPGMSGDLEGLALYAGQAAALVHEIRPAAVIVHKLVDDAIRVFRDLQLS